MTVNNQAASKENQNLSPSSPPRRPTFDLRLMNSRGSFHGSTDSIKSSTSGTNSTLTAMAGTPQWMAPELCHNQVRIEDKLAQLKSDERDSQEVIASRRSFIEDHQRINYGQAVDVYAFAVTLYEIMTHKVPWEGTSINGIFRKVSNGCRPSLQHWPKHAPEGWRDLMCSCWEQDPASRPDFKEIYTALQRQTRVHAAKVQQERQGTQTGDSNSAVELMVVDV